MGCVDEPQIFWQASRGQVVGPAGWNVPLGTFAEGTLRYTPTVNIIHLGVTSNISERDPAQYAIKKAASAPLRMNYHAWLLSAMVLVTGCYGGGGKLMAR